MAAGGQVIMMTDDVRPAQPCPTRPRLISRILTGMLHSAWPPHADRIAWVRSVLCLNRAWRLFILGFTVLMAGLLVGPRIPNELQRDNCVGNIQLPGPFGIHLNCDAPEFLALATHPTGLLTENNYRQSRPGLILFAAVLTAPLSVFATSVGDTTPPQDDPERIIDSFARYLPAYIAYMLLNAGILLLSFHFLRKTIERAPSDERSAIPIVVSVGLLLVTNDVTKAFFWSPHTQMFNILVPVMAVYAAVRVWHGALASRRLAVGLGFFVGFGFTAYGVFAIIPACVIAVSLLAIPRKRIGRCNTAVNLGLMLVLSVLPTALWYFIVREVTGDFFSAEVNEEAFVWMLQTWNHGFSTLVAEWLSKFDWMLRYAAPQALALFVAVLFLLWMAWKNPVNARRALRDSSASTGAGLFVSGAILVFYTSVGWIFPRLAFPIIPPLIVAMGAFAVAFAQSVRPELRLILTRGISMIAVANLIYVVAKDGPFS